MYSVVQSFVATHYRFKIRSTAGDRVNLIDPFEPVKYHHLQINNTVSRCENYNHDNSWWIVGGEGNATSRPIAGIYLPPYYDDQNIYPNKSSVLPGSFLIRIPINDYWYLGDVKYYSEASNMDKTITTISPQVGDVVFVISYADENAQSDNDFYFPDQIKYTSIKLDVNDQDFGAFVYWKFGTIIDVKDDYILVKR